MPISPLTLNRRKPTLAEIIAQIDRGLIMSTRTTLATATSLYVDAPFGYDEYLDDIITQYEAAGWLKVQVRRGKNRLQDKLEFFSFEYTPVADVKPLPVVSVSAEEYAITAGGQVLLGINAAPVADGAPIALVEIYQGNTLLISSTVQSSLPFLWQNVPAGTHIVTGKVTDSKGNVGISTPITITAAIVVIPPVVNQPPTVTLTSNSTAIAAGESVTLTATANDFDGRLASLSIYEGTTLLTAASLGVNSITATLPFVWTNIPAGTHTLTAKAIDNEGLVTISTAINVVAVPVVVVVPVVVTPPTQFNLLVPITADYWYNSSIARPSSGRTIHAALSVLKINLNGATTVAINAVNTGGGSMLVLDGATVKGSMDTGTYTFTGLSGGTLTTIAGAQQRSYEEGEVGGSDVLNITLGNEVLGNFIAPAQATTAIVVIGDSISNGSGASQPQLTGWTAKLRDANTRATYVTGYGSSQGVVIGAQANWTNLKAQISAALAGATNKVIVWALGSNDAMGAHSPGACTLADYMTSFNAFLANTEAEFPDISRIIFTPIYRRGEATVVNGFGWHMQDLRDAEVAAVYNKHKTYLLDGLPVCLDSDIGGDGAHPVDSGHQKIATAVATAVDSVIAGVYVQPVPIVTPPVVVTPPTGISVTNRGVEWVTLVNASVSGNRVYKTGLNIGWDSNAVASCSMSTTPGAGEKARVSVSNITVPVSNSPDYPAAFIGLTNTIITDPLSYVTIKHGLYWNTSIIRVFENGVFKTSAPKPNTPFSVAVVATDSFVSYEVDGLVIYTSALPAVYPYLVVSAFDSNDAGGHGISEVVGATITGVNVTLPVAQTVPVMIISG